MNRADRRAAARAERRQQGSHGLDCGCRTHRLVPLDVPRCPDCGDLSALIGPEGVWMPTSRPSGSLSTIEVGCPCGAIYALTVAVE